MTVSIINHNHMTDSNLEESGRMFNANSVLDITAYIETNAIGKVRDEVDKLTEEFGLRRDLTIKTTGYTPRRMTNVDYDTIAEKSSLLMDIYADPNLLQLLAQIVGECVYLCPYDSERMVITSLQRRGDSHGWHWDDYSFAMIWVLQAPEKEKGGVVQCVPNTQWDRRKPTIISHFIAQPIHTYYFPQGSVYIMRSNTTMHRVYPLLDPTARRTILNNTYASKSDLSLNINHSSMEELFAKPGRVKYQA